MPLSFWPHWRFVSVTVSAGEQNKLLLALRDELCQTCRTHCSSILLSGALEYNANQHWLKDNLYSYATVFLDARGTYSRIMVCLYSIYTRSIYPFMMYCGKIKGADQYAGVKAEVLFHRWLNVVQMYYIRQGYIASYSKTLFQPFPLWQNQQHIYGS